MSTKRNAQSAFGVSRLKLGRESGHDGGDRAIVSDVSSRFVGPDGSGTDAALFGPLLAFLLKVGTTNELDTESVVIGFGVLYGVNKVGWLTAEVGLICTTAMGQSKLKGKYSEELTKSEDRSRSPPWKWEVD